MYISVARSLKTRPVIRACDRQRGQLQDNSLARPGRKQARKHIRDARDFTNMETRAVIKFFLQDKAQKEVQAILTETLACFLPGGAKDLSAPQYYSLYE